MIQPFIFGIAGLAAISLTHDLLAEYNERNLLRPIVFLPMECLGNWREKESWVSTSEPDDVLIRRAQEDPAAFEPLYERYVDQIYAYVYYRVGNVQDAEDITARTFYQALTHLNRYTSRGVPFSAWLFRIAHNLVANWHRDGNRRQLLPLDAATATPDPAQSLSDNVEESEEKQNLWQVIRRLPPERQQLLILKFVDDLPMAQIAIIMGRSEGAVKALLHRTLVSLRQQLLQTQRGSYTQ